MRVNGFRLTVDPDKHGRVFSYVGIMMALATRSA
jgi:hypothetical protein